MLKKMEFKKSIILPWIAIIVMMYAMTSLQVSMGLRNLLFVVTASVCLWFSWRKNSESKWEIIVLLIGLFARIAICYLNEYMGDAALIGGGNDGATFLLTATEYYNGDFHRVYTRYPYVLYGIFQVTGVNPFAAIFVNVICWGLSVLVMQKSCKRLHIKGIYRILALLILAWLPTNIWITTILYRDTLVMLFVFLSFYLLLCWMQEGKIKNVILAVVMTGLATLLHGGSIMALIPIAVTVVFYSRESECFRFTKKNILLICAIAVCLIVFLLIPPIGEVLLRKIPSMENGPIEMLNGWLAAKYDYSSEAGSNYLVGRYLTGYFDLIPMTIQRVYYHMFSPAPDMWRGIVDIAAFFGSTALIYGIAMLLWIVSIFRKSKDAYRFVMFMEIATTVVLYAWANVNAGAALRHREKIIGMIILMGMHSLNILNPDWVKLTHLIPDKYYLALRYKMKLGEWPNLKNPKLYTEKIQWLKLYDRKPEYVTMVDKCEAKKYIADRVGEQYIIPTYGVWDKFDDIDFDCLPNRFVLKCTHNSGGVMVCMDKTCFEFEKARKIIEDCLAGNYYWHSREWQYKDVTPRIIAEEYLYDTDYPDDSIMDYKFLCFHGEPKLIYYAEENTDDPYADIYDMDFQKLAIQFPEPNSPIKAEKPERFEEMKEIARKLSQGFAHLRVDFYEVNGKLYVGELTFYHCAGMFKIEPEQWNMILGDWITLPGKN